MLRVTWRNLVARKFRLLLSAFAIILGVSFVSGTLVFTNALGGAFDKIVEGSTADVEIAFEGTSDFNALQDNRTIPASVLGELEALDEVDSVYPQVFLATVFVIGKDGKVVGGNGPPGLAFNFTGVKNIAGDPALKLIGGALPEGPGEVALETATLEKAGYSLGDTVTFAAPGPDPTIEAKLVGEVEFAASSNGATISVFEVGYLQDAFLNGEDAFNTISLTKAEGFSQAQAASAAQAVLPPEVEARAGDVVVADAKEQLDQIFGFITIFLLVFAAVALFVGIFLILNTFSMLVAQRSRELALLRAMGASRRQILMAVVTEAVAVGLIGATVGLAGGWLLANGLKALFAAIGLDLGDVSFALTPTAVVVSYLVGVVVTAIAGIFPALRASRIAPVAAMRDDVSVPDAHMRRRVLIGAVLVAGGFAAIAAGFSAGGGGGLSVLGLGTALVLVGASRVSPLIGRPVIEGFGVVYRRLDRAVGNLATENSLRDPRRTAATASMLMIGLALMTLAAIFGASANKSTEAAIESTVSSQFVISNVIGQPFSTAVAEQASDIDGVAAVASVRQAFPRVDKERSFVVAIDPAALPAVLAVPTVDGSLADLGPGTAVTTAENAASQGYAIGDEIDMEFQGGVQKLTLAATIPVAASLSADWIVDPQTFVDGGLTPLDSFIYIAKEPAADTDAVRGDLDTLIKDLPTVTVKDPEQLVAEQKKQTDQFLYLIYGLLGLSIVIALLGVVNTLGLSIIERTREIGLLRAVGLTRLQIGRMIMLESIVIAVFGALLGVVLGTAFGATIVRALKDQGLTDLAIPWPALVGFLMLAAVLGVLAALVPGWRASRLDVLKAITTE